MYYCPICKKNVRKTCSWSPCKLIHDMEDTLHKKVVDGTEKTG